MTTAWKFPDAPNTACYATTDVLNGSPVKHVYHDYAGDWQFHGTSHEETASAFKMVCLIDEQNDGYIGRIDNCPHHPAASYGDLVSFHSLPVVDRYNKEQDAAEACGSHCCNMLPACLITNANGLNMLDHVSLTVVDLERAERFYDAIFAALDVPKVGSDHADAWIGYGERSDADHPERSYFSVRLGPAPDDAPRRHYCFKAPSRAAVQAFWRAGLAHGGLDLGAPGLRDYHANYYAAFLFDPDGNRIEAVCHRADAG